MGGGWGWGETGRRRKEMSCCGEGREEGEGGKLRLRATGGLDKSAVSKRLYALFLVHIYIYIYIILIYSYSIFTSFHSDIFVSTKRLVKLNQPNEFS